MNNTSELLNAQKAYFNGGETLGIAFRKTQLKKLYQAVTDNQQAIFDALHADLNKSPFETYETEIGIVLEEIRYLIAHLSKWAKPKRMSMPLTLFPARGTVHAEPYGCVLIMSPWNYPFQLALDPLAGALAAGNCVVLKPSNYSPETSKVIQKIIRSIYPEKYVAVIEGGREANADLLEKRFDYIFFTGGTTVGRLVMESAAKHLTPVSLELGGKSPCIVVVMFCSMSSVPETTYPKIDDCIESGMTRNESAYSRTSPKMPAASEPFLSLPRRERSLCSQNSVFSARNQLLLLAILIEILLEFACPVRNESVGIGTQL